MMEIFLQQCLTAPDSVCFCKVYCLEDSRKLGRLLSLFTKIIEHVIVTYNLALYHCFFEDLQYLLKHTNTIYQQLQICPKI